MKSKRTFVALGLLLASIALLSATMGLLSMTPMAAASAKQAAAELPIIDDFEDGLPAGLSVFSDKIDGAAGGKTTVSAVTATMDLPTIPPITDTTVLSFSYDLIINDWGYAYGGFNRAFDTTQDWSSYDGLSFWFYGMNTGNTIEVELWDGGTSGSESERFEHEFVDDVAGWRQFKLPFADFERASDYQPPGAPTDGVLDLTDVWGYNFGIVTSPSSGQFRIDNVELYMAPLGVDDFEGGLPSSFSVFSDKIDGAAGGKTTVTAVTATMDLPTIPPITDTTVLSFSYDLIINEWGYAYGGFNRAFDTSQDWSSYDGLSFWFYGMNTGNTIEVELWDGGTGGSESERFEHEFVDDVAGWRQFKLPFADFDLATDYQPPGAPTDGVLDLTAMWGYNFGIVTSPSSGHFRIDNVELCGGPSELTVNFEDTDYTVGEGEVATITATLNMTATHPVTVSYATSDGTATAGDDYAATSGALVFPPDTAMQTFTVATLDDGDEEDDETVTVTLSDPVSATLGARSEATLTILDDDAAEAGPAFVDVIDDFESGLPSGEDANGLGIGFVTWGDTWNGTTVAITTTSTASAGIEPVPDKEGTNQVIELEAMVVGWGGLTHAFENETVDEWVSQDWSTYEGIAFWYHGTGTGTTVFLDVLENRNPGSTTDDAERWSTEWIDDTAGWQLIQIPFSDLSRKEIDNGAPNDGWTGEEVHGWALGTVGTGGETEVRYVDDVGLLQRVTTVDDFESGLPSGEDPNGLGIGFVTWGDTWNGTTVAITTTSTASAGIEPVPDKEGTNQVIELEAMVVGWGGFTHAFENETVDEWVSQDWSTYEGIAFWYHGTGTGTTVFLDVLENRNPGSTTDDAERWSTEWIDDTAGWQLIQIPFSDLSRKEINNGAPNDGWTGEEVHGWALGTVGTDGETEVRYVDDVSIYGNTGEGEEVLKVEFSNSSYEVAEGEVADLTVTLNMTTTDSVIVTYATAEAYATAGRDYTPISGTLVFAPGETEQTLPVVTLDDIKYEGDEGVMVNLSDPVNVTMGFQSRALLTIVDDDAFDPLLLDDFEGFHRYDTTGDVTLDITEIAAGSPTELPAQGVYENVLAVDYGTSLLAADDVGFGRTFAESRDWSGYGGLSFWYYGGNSGETITLEILDNQAATTADVDPAKWELVWSDEFDDPVGTAPNPNVWRHELGDGTMNGIPGWGNSESQYYTHSTDNAATDGDGNLVITLSEVNTSTTDLRCWYGPCEYTSARLISEDRAEFAYGRVESRIRVPTGPSGLWPAFWMLGTDIGEVGWPQCGEIDIMEYVSRIPDEIFGTIHGPGYSGGASFGNTYVFNEPVSTTFHTFAVEWQPDHIDWYVDDILYHTAEPSDVAPDEWVFNHPFYIIMNLAIGGNFGGSISDDMTSPQEMLVDYVRVYQAEDTAERFEATFVDDFTGWRRITVDFGALTRSPDQPDGAPDDGLGLTEVWGYGFALPSAGSGSFYIDQVRLEAEYRLYLPLIAKQG